jgi:hypothetical protein
MRIMPPTPSPSPGARSSAEVNARIRALFRPRWGRGLTAEERGEYEALLAEWKAAVRAEGQGGYGRAA